MMTAKARGKNQTIVFDEETGERPEVGPPTQRDVRSIAHLKMLQSLAGKLNRLNDVRQIGTTIVDELRTLIDYHNCRIHLVEGDELVPIVFSGVDAYRQESYDALRVKIGEGITGRAAETGDSVLVRDALRCEFMRQVPGTEPIDESMIAVPLRYGSRVIGVIGISKLGVGQFDEDDVRLLEVLAGQASVALENARLYEAQRREAENLKALLEFTVAMSRASSLEAIGDETVWAAARLLNSEQSSLWLRTRSGDYCAAAQYGYLDDPAAEPILALRFRADIAERLLDGRTEPFLLPASAAEEIFPVVPDVTWRSAAVAPLQRGGGIDGWLIVRAPSGDAGRFTDEHLRLLAGLSYQASIALERARLYGDEKESAETARSLLEFSRALASAEGLREVSERIVELSARIVGSLRTSVWLQEDDSPELSATAVWGYPDETRKRLLSRRFGAALANRLLEHVEPFLLEPVQLRALTGNVQVGDHATFALAPMRLDGGRLGCIVAAIPPSDEADAVERKLRLLAGLAHQAKLALANAGSFANLESTFVSTVEALANALEAKDEYTSSHTRWITDMALEVGRALGLDAKTLKRL